MATTKSMKIQAEIDKVKAKISEQQARLKELEQKKLEAENSEIVDIVRGMSISLTPAPRPLRSGSAGRRTVLGRWRGCRFPGIGHPSGRLRQRSSECRCDG